MSRKARYFIVFLSFISELPNFDHKKDEEYLQNCLTFKGLFCCCFVFLVLDKYEWYVNLVYE